jgi:CheY-like chemotaxis protein
MTTPQSAPPVAEETRPTILVVDDEPAIRRLVPAILQQQGYAVLLAPTGAEAIRLYQNHSGVIRTVLLDIRMPGLDGPATLEALRTLDPQVCCYFLSGDFGGYDTEELLQRGARGVLRKPFQVEELVRLLDRPPVGATLPDLALASDNDTLRMGKSLPETR